MSKRYLMWTLTTFVATLFLCTLLSFKVLAIAALILLLALIPAIFFRFSWKKLAIPCLIAFILSFAYYTWTDYRLNKIQNALIGTEAKITGEIVDVGDNAAGNLCRYKVRLSEFNEKKVKFYDSSYIQLYLSKGTLHTPGTMVEGNVIFFETPVKFGSGREDRLLLNGTCEENGLNFTKPLRKTLSAVLFEFRSAMQSNLSFGGEKTIGLLHSVCFGNKDTLDPGLNVSLRRCGLTHVTAVSGLHLSFTVLLFNMLMMSVGLHYRVRYIIDIFICVLFTAMVGFPLSCIRACIMMVLMCIALSVNLFDDGLTSLSVAAFVIVLFNPYAIRDVGFLLSVTATAGIIIMRLPIEDFLFPKKISTNFRVNWLYRKFTGAFACSVAATLATLPIMILVFGSISLIGPIANVLLIYPLQWIFMMGILMVMLGWIPFLGSVFGWLCDLLYVVVDATAGVLGRFPFSSISSFNWIGVFILTLFLGVVGIGLYHYFAKQRRSALVLLTLLLCLTFTFQFIHGKRHPNNYIEIAFVDVGQGDCTVISRGHSAVVLDYGGTSAKRYNLIEYLKKKNIYAVELLGFTHLHSDHTNGFNTLLNHAYIDEILYPEIGVADPELLTTIRSENGIEITRNLSKKVLGEVEVSVLADALLDETTQSGNECCVCYRVTIGETVVLVTGDLSGEAELLLKDQIGDATILKVSHHGSDTSSLYPFLKAVSPEVSVISVGDNPYGLPKDSVVERLKTVSSAVYQTGEEGTIIFRTDGKNLERIFK